MSARTFAEALRVETAMLQAQHPTRENEIARACALIANGQVVPMADGTARVLSSTDATVWYDVTAAACSCPDAQYRKVHCKHLSAWKLYQHIQHQVDTAPPPVPLDVTPTALPPGPGLPLPEAPASVNVRVCVGGRDVQITLRDTDETRLLERLTTLLERYPVEPSNALVQPTDTTPRCPTHGAMKPSTKGKGWYCPHKLDDATWCQSKSK
jgi:hypothetical protein